MLNRILLLFVFLVFITRRAVSQHLLGGQIRTEYIYVSSPPRIQMSLELYRTADSSPRQNVSFNWGDGTIENLELIETGFAAQNLAVDYYRGSHYYDTTGYMIYEYRDSFLVDDVLNIPNSGEHYLYLTDTVLVCDGINTPILHPAINSYEGLIPLGGVENFLLLEDGSIIKPFSLYSFVGSPPAASISTLLPYPIEGSTLPEATDSLRFLYNYLFIWDRPIASGKYGFRFHNRQMSNTNNPIYVDLVTEEGHILTNTLTRLIILEVTEDMIVNSFNHSLEQELNPTKSHQRSGASYAPKNTQ